MLNTPDMIQIPSSLQSDVGGPYPVYLPFSSSSLIPSQTFFPPDPVKQYMVPSRVAFNSLQEEKQRELAVQSMPTTHSQPELCNNLSDEVQLGIACPPMLVEPKQTKVVYSDEGRPFGLRCVCDSDKISDCLILHCVKCGLWCHGACVGVAYSSNQQKFICPYCDNKPLRCHCENNLKYDEPIIQCQKCGYYSHKSCSKLRYGPNPIDFFCKQCGSLKYQLPLVQFGQKSLIQDFKHSFDCDRSKLLKRIPDGAFKRMLVADLDKSELEFHQMMENYFNIFAPTFFQCAHDFWFMFVTTFSELFKCEKNLILEAIDELTFNLLYDPVFIPKHRSSPSFIIADSVVPYLDSAKIPDYDETGSITKVSVSNGIVKSKCDFKDNQLICTLSGILSHQNEVNVARGISRSCVALTDTHFVLDASKLGHSFVSSIRRSFHFNCITKLIRVQGDYFVGLFAVRTIGPVNEFKRVNDPQIAIPKGGELLLPLDGDLPYDVFIPLWKDKKQIVSKKPEVKKKNPPEYKSKQPPKPKKEKQTCPYSLSLLSSFYSEYVPPLPIKILSQNEIDERNRFQNILRQRKSKNEEISKTDNTYE